jgi:S-adenosyl-L-methionine hydrolase (adenosine-forming)
MPTARARAERPRTNRATGRRATPRPVITLTSDFGLHDPYVGIMKSRILQRAPQIALIDLTHEIAPFQPEQAGYWLWCAYPQFPAGSVHVAVVDPGVGGARSIIVLAAGGHHFIAPDNGLLGLIARSRSDARAYRLDPRALSALGLTFASATFHGRDVMGPLGAELAAGRVRPERLGERTELLLGQLRPAVRTQSGELEGQVAVVDHFGNVLTTIGAEDLRPFRVPQVVLGRQSFRLVHTYAEARPDECVALINSSARLELAVREGSAAARLQPPIGAAVQVLERNA